MSKRETCVTVCELEKQRFEPRLKTYILHGRTQKEKCRYHGLNLQYSPQSRACARLVQAAVEG